MPLDGTGGSWKHSGFNLFRGEAVVGTHRAELENLAQYILRHSFSVEKMTYLPQNGRVVYHSRMNQTTRRNFEVFTAVDFLAAVTRHIPDKGAQIVKYYGWYSNKARGQRARNAVGRAGPPGPPSSAESAIANPQSKIRKKIPSRTWRELIKKIWNTDPLPCPAIARGREGAKADLPEMRWGNAADLVDRGPAGN